MSETTVQGGYACFTTAQLWSLCRLASDKRLSLAAVRVYLACKEMLERRTGTENSAFYRVAEIGELTGLSERASAKALTELQQHELMEHSEESITFHDRAIAELEEAPFGTAPGRLVPIPRRLVRILSAHTKKNEILVTLIHCARSLFLLAGKMVRRGAVKSSWIQSVFRIGRTAVTATRAWLRSLGFLAPQGGIEQWRLNRYGYYYQILGGHYPERRKRQPSKSVRIGTPYKRTPFNKLKPNNQYPRRDLRRPPRLRTGAHGRDFRSEPGTITNIQFEDLKRLSRLLPLFEQATKAGWLSHSEASRINFVAAAVRATRVQGDSVRIFVGIVRKGLWHHITSEQECRAVQALKRHRGRLSRVAADETPSLIASLVQRVGSKMGHGSVRSFHEPRKTLKRP